MSKDSIHFLINPISGGVKKSGIEKLIAAYLDTNKFDYEIHWTKYSGHGYKLARQASESGVKIVCAVGGDGSVHNIASALVGSNTIMAIIPIGSGNGLARHLQIPVIIKDAIVALNQMKVRRIDVGQINRKYFFNVAGFGFDGHISALFAKTKKRGFSNYARLVLREFFKAKELDYALKFDNNTELQGKALMLSVANGSEFGNGFSVSPISELHDGKLELVITKKPNFLAMPSLFMKALKRKIHTSSYVKTYKFSSLVLQVEDEFHADGEPIKVRKPIHIEVKPKALRVIAGENYV